MDKIVSDTIEVINDSIKALNKKHDLTPSELEVLCKAYKLKIEVEDFYGDGMENNENGMSHGYSGAYNGRYYNRMNRPMAYMPMDYMNDSFMNHNVYQNNDYAVQRRSPVTGRYISRDGEGMSSHSIKDRMIARLEAMYDEASSEHEREEIRKEIRNIEANK